MATDSWIDKSPTCGGWNNTLSLGNRFNPLAMDRVILGQYGTKQIMYLGTKSTTNFDIHLRLIPDKFPNFRLISGVIVLYNLVLTADVKQRKQHILNNEPNPDNSP